MPYPSSSFEKEQLFHTKKQESHLAMRRRPSLAPVVTSLLLFAGTFFLFNSLFASLDIDYGASKPREPVSQSDSICLTPACVIAAAEILQNLSPRHQEIDPCENFDKFVCEGWEEKHDLRADQGSIFTGTIMAERSQQILRHVLESPYSDAHPMVAANSTAEQEIFQKLQDQYEACMDENKIKEIGVSPLIGALRKIGDLFPAADPESKLQKHLLNTGENRLSNTIIYLQSIGVNALFVFGIGADDKDPDSTVLALTAPRSPGLPSKQYYQNEPVVADYSITIGQVLEALLRQSKHDSPFSEAFTSVVSEDLVKSLVGFESRLAEVTPDAEDAEDITKYYNPLSLEETKALAPQLAFDKVITALAPQGYTPDKIIVGSPGYLKTLSRILEDTTVETLQAYFVWKTVQAYAQSIEDDALKPLRRFNNGLQGKEPDATEERWRFCINLADDGLGWILSRLFIEKAFSEKSRIFGDSIVTDIKEQFTYKLNAAEWMTEEVRKLGIEKVHNIVQKIGYPTISPDIRNASSLQEYYDGVNISHTGFFQNAISVARFDVRREWSALGKPTNRDEWGMTAPTVNAYYNPAGNEIVFPAGIMQAPVFYDPSVPNYLSYGAFGSVSGHELSHAFDSTGRHYDQTGNFTEWWDNKTVEAFTSKVTCFVNQYHEFTVPGPDDKPLHVNGALTLGENIADAGGLSASFKAWKQIETKKPSQLLPGLQDFTRDQVFFISYANWWCGKDRKEAAINRIYQDPHAPKWARILGTMANSREFKESFQCPTKLPTCELW